MRIFFCAVLMASFFIALAPSTTNAQDITVTLLGTGCPPAVMNRFGPSILLKLEGRNSSLMQVVAPCNGSIR
jgi:ribonuclease Z